MIGNLIWETHQLRPFHSEDRSHSFYLDPYAVRKWLRHAYGREFIPSFNHLARNPVALALRIEAVTGGAERDNGV